MNKQDLLGMIDHTLLRPNAVIEDYLQLATEATIYEVPAVCVPPNRVALMRSLLPDEVHVGTVVGFPLGYNTTVSKVQEARQAIMCGAREIDMVIDIGAAVGTGQTDDGLRLVQQEIAWVRKECQHGVILKVIIETCYLNRAQKVDLCRIVSNEGADYIKTSTGFGPKGATLDDIALFRLYLSPEVKIKAAGGISTIADAKAFVEAGCSRIGSSKLVPLLAQIEGDEI